jgi:hypothetical protein
VTELGLARAYDVAACRANTTTVSPPSCLYTFTSSQREYLDSGTITFARNRSFTMAFWFHSCFNPCSPDAGGGGALMSVTGTYVLNGQYIELSANNSRLATIVTATLPDSVPSSWTGPDTVFFTQGYYGNWKTILLGR